MGSGWGTVVLLAADGRTAPQIAPLVQRSPETVWRVLQRYQAGGPAGWPPGPGPGAPWPRPRRGRPSCAG